LADFDLNIELRLQTQRLNQQLKQAESQLNKLSRRGVTVDPQLAQTPDQLRAIANSAGATAKGLDTLSRANRAAAQTNTLLTSRIEKTTSETEKLGQQTRITVRRFTGYLIASRGISTLVDTLAGATREALEFNRELVRVAQLANVTNASTRGLANTISEVSQSYGTSAVELARVAQVFLQAGKSISETQTLLEAVGQTTLTASFPDLRTTANSILALNTQFRLLERQSTDVFDSLNAVAKEANTSVAELFDGLRRGGAAFAALSGATERATGSALNLDNLREFSAIFATVIETTRESGATVGTSLRTILPRLNRRETVEVLRDFNIELQKTNEQTNRTEFIGAANALREIGEALSGLAPTDPAFSRIAEQIGGLRQFNRVVPLLTRTRRIQELLTEAQSSSGSVAEDVALAQQNLSVQIEKLQQRFAALARTIVGSEAFQTIAGTFITTANAAVSLANALEPLIPLIAAIGTVRIGASLLGAGRGFARGRGFNSGGRVGGSINAMTTKGEIFIEESQLGKYGGASNVLAYNNYNAGGRIRGATEIASGVHLFTAGSAANVDSIPTELPPGVVIRRSGAARFLSQGFNKGGRVGFNVGGRSGSPADLTLINSLAQTNQRLFAAANQAFQRLVGAGENAGASITRVASIIRNASSDLAAVNKLTAEGVQNSFDALEESNVLTAGNRRAEEVRVQRAVDRQGREGNTTQPDNVRGPVRGGGTNSGSLNLPSPSQAQKDQQATNEFRELKKNLQQSEAIDLFQQQETSIKQAQERKKSEIEFLKRQSREAAARSAPRANARDASATQARSAFGVVDLTNPATRAQVESRRVNLGGGTPGLKPVVKAELDSASAQRIDALQALAGVGPGQQFGPSREAFESNRDARLRRDALDALNPAPIESRLNRIRRRTGVVASNIRDRARSAIDARRPGFSQLFGQSQFLSAASVGAGIGGLALGQSEDNTIRSVGAGLTGAAVGAQFGGPVGAAVGALVGLEGTLRNLTKAANTEELEKFRDVLADIIPPDLSGDISLEKVTQEISNFAEATEGDLREFNVAIRTQSRQFRRGIDSGLVGLNQRDRADFNRASLSTQGLAVASDIFLGGLERRTTARDRVVSSERAARQQEINSALGPTTDVIKDQLDTFARTALQERIRSGETLPSVNDDSDSGVAVVDRLSENLGQSFLNTLNEAQIRSVGLTAGGGQSGEAVLLNRLRDNIDQFISDINAQSISNEFSKNLSVFSDRIDIAAARLQELSSSLARNVQSFEAIGSGRVQGQTFSGDFSNLRGPAAARAAAELTNLTRVTDSSTARLTSGLINDRATVQNQLAGSIQGQLRSGQANIGTSIEEVVSNFLDNNDISAAGRDAIERGIQGVEGTLGGLLEGNNLRNLTNTLSELEEFERAAKFAGDGLKVIEQSSASLANAFNTINSSIIEFERGLSEQRGREFSQRQQSNQFFGRGAPQGTRAATLSARLFSRSQTQFFSGGISATNNSGIGDRILELRNALQNGGLSQQAQAQANLEIARLTQALTLNASQTAALASVNNELASIGQARQGSRSLLESLATGGATAQRQATRNLDVFRAFAGGGNVRSEDLGGALQTARQFAGSLNADQLASGAFDNVFGTQVRSSEDLENLIASRLGQQLGGVAGNASTRDILANTLTPNALSGPDNPAELDAISRREQLFNLENEARREQLRLQEDLINRQIAASETLANSQIAVAFTSPLRIEGTETFTNQLAEKVGQVVQQNAQALVDGANQTPTPGVSPAGDNGA